MTERHESLFVTGEYVSAFRPDHPGNPFAKIYAAKRDTVVAAVSGSERQVLDIGGGYGRMAIPLSRRHVVTLADLSVHMLAQAQPYCGKRLRLCGADARALPFADETFDYVLCIDVVPHLPNPMTCLQEARRVLRRGGTLIVDSTNSMPLWTLAYPRYMSRSPRRWIAIWRSHGVLPEWRSRVWHHRRSRFLGMIADARFEVRSVEGFGPSFCPKWHLAIAEAV